MAEDNSSVEKTTENGASTAKMIGGIVGGLIGGVGSMVNRAVEWIVTYVVLIVLASIVLGIISSSGEKDKSLDWHKARTKAEVWRRIKDRLSGELAALGLDASNIVYNAKTHPTRFRSCVPEHKRSRWLVLSTNEETVISRRFVEEGARQGCFADMQDQISRVRAIVEKLVAAVPEIDAIPEVHILRDDSVNACCLPDGTVFVNEGTLKKIPDDSLLAAILSHELGHAAARHGNESLSYALIGAAGGVMFEEWAAGVAPILDSGEGVSLVREMYGLSSAVGFHLPRSRLNESEADRLGVRYLARAGFDPCAMVRLFQWFEAIAPQDSDTFKQLFSTHPIHAERAVHVREVLSEPDLYEMPKETLRGKLKKKTDEIDFTKTHAAVSNLTSRLPKKPKLPWGRKEAEDNKKE